MGKKKKSGPDFENMTFKNECTGIIYLFFLSALNTYVFTNTTNPPANLQWNIGLVEFRFRVSASGSPSCYFRDAVTGHGK